MSRKALLNAVLVAHAVPYPMMMPPPPNVPHQGYEGAPAPPVQMGGHA